MPRITLGAKAVRIRRNLSDVKQYEIFDYSKGMATYPANDVHKDGVWRLAQDARIGALGEYETRHGADFHSDAAGEATTATQTATSGAADQSFGESTYLAQKVTTAGAGRLTKVEVRLKNSASATGEVLVELYTSSSGAPGTLLATSSVAASVITSSYAYLTARFMSAPALTTATDYWIVLRIQPSGSNSYRWSSTTAASTASLSTDDGGSWTAQSFALNFRAYLATDSPSKGIFRAYKSDGTKVTLMAHGTSLYSVDNSTGALTAIKTGLNASATDYRFAIVNDIVYYVNGYDGYRKWNFTTESQVSSTNYSNILVHKGLMFLNRTDDPNRWDFSNFAAYETFTSTDFIYVPGPKTGDPSTAAVSINGTLVIWTRFRKYVLYGDDNATFLLQEAAGKKGTFTQETVASDKNYAYFLSDDGVYRFDGSSDKLISQNIYEDILGLTNKDDCALSVNQGRLRLYYPSAGSSANDSCIVFSLNFESVESYDTETYVNNALTAFNDEDALMVASSVVGQVYWQELSSNDYSNLGGLISWELRTHYNPFGKPSSLKQVRKWRSRFAAQSGNYVVTQQAAYELRDEPEDRSFLDVQGEGATWGGGYTWGGGAVWGTAQEVEGSQYIPGQYRRIQVRYKHHAVRQPQRFLGHSFTTWTRAER